MCSTSPTLERQSQQAKTRGRVGLIDRAERKYADLSDLEWRNGVCNRTRTVALATACTKPFAAASVTLTNVKLLTRRYDASKWSQWSLGSIETSWSYEHFPVPRELEWRCTPLYPNVCLRRGG